MQPSTIVHISVFEVHLYMVQLIHLDVIQRNVQFVLFESDASWFHIFSIYPIVVYTLSLEVKE